MKYKLESSLVIRLLFVILPVPLMSGCSTLDYYQQSIWGQLEILQKSEPVDRLLKNNNLSEQIRYKLEKVTEIRDFAITDLGLPDNNSYRQYADLGRKYVVWNVFASPELSLDSLEWCYPVAGCLAYRGYFSEQDASILANKLEKQGYDVFIGGVSAYSTLGWFADPVLNTMLKHDTAYLARIIFHELAHQKVYIKDDTEFNEAFADTVALAGIKRWFDKNGSQDSREEFARSLSQEDAFVDLVLRYREQLDEIYRSSLGEDDKRMKKNIVFQKMINEYMKIRSDRGQDAAYDSWFALGLNNAKLLAVSTYRRLVPGFERLLSAVNGDLESFYKLVADLGKCDQQQRRQVLSSGNTGFSC